jgi:hypothetical protein
MPFHPAERSSSVVAALLVAAGVMVAVAGCIQILPVGPGAGPSMPPARQLGSPITVQVMRSQPPTATGACPAGWLEVFLAPSILPHASTAGAQPVPGQSADRVPGGTTPSAGAGSGAPAFPETAPALAPSPLPCYHPVGAPVTITSAAVSAVVAYPVPRGQPKGLAPYGFTVAVPAAEVAPVTALIMQAYDSRDALGISVAGKLWEAPQVDGRFSGRQLGVAVLTRDQALKLYRILVPPG